MKHLTNLMTRPVHAIWSAVPVTLALTVLVLALLPRPLPAAGDDATVYPAPTTWQAVYDPRVLLDFHVRLTAEDYATIQADETFDLRVPAVFWVGNIHPDPGAWHATIRRKSATPIGEKVSYRLRLESRIGGGSSRWNNLRSFSLENGDDQDVVSEGLAWFLHRQAWDDAHYLPGLAAWVTLTMHVEQETADGTTVDVRPQGVYLNVELPDKRFLQNRGLWHASDASRGAITWLYKQDDIGLPELKEWPFDSTPPESDSPAYEAMDYPPFQPERLVRRRLTNPTPDDATLAADLNHWIDMESMLRLGAVNAFTSNPDELFNKGKNFFWADFGDNPSSHRPRQYFPWDLDAAIRKPEESIYGTLRAGRKATQVEQHPYQSVILNHPEFRQQYNRVMTDLIHGPLGQAEIEGFLDASAALLSDALLADPNNQIGTTPAAVNAHFESLKAWSAARHVSVRAQLNQDGPPAPRK
jgi:hypothetical protein